VSRLRIGRVRALQIALVVASGALLVDMLRRADLRRAGRLVLEVGPRALLLLVPGLVAILLQAIGWRPVLHFLGRRVRTVRLAAIRLASEAVFMSVPAGAVASDYVALSLLQRRADVPVPEGLAAIAARRVLVILTNGIYVALALALGHSHLGRASVGLGGVSWLAWAMVAAALVLLGSASVMALAVFSGTVAARLRRLLSHIPLGSARAWLSDRAARFDETDRQFGRLASMPRSSLVGSAMAFLAVWVIEAVETLIALRLVGAPVGFTDALSIEVLVSLLRSIAFVLPSGIGVQDAGYIALLGAFEVPDAATTGVAFLIIKRAKELFWITIGYGVLALLAGTLRGVTPPTHDHNATGRGD
jgi:hypothetical protein